MKKGLIVLSATIAMSFAASSAFAAGSEASSMTVNGGTIKFIGSVTDAPCTVSVDALDHLVMMDPVRTAHLTTAGEASGMPTTFTIELKDCDTSTYTNASLTFTGTADSTVSTALYNAASSDPATHVALQLFDKDGKQVDLNDTSSSVTATLANGANSIPMKVDYVATDAAATAGSVEATATMQITYS